KGMAQSQLSYRDDVGELENYFLGILRYSYLRTDQPHRGNPHVRKRIRFNLTVGAIHRKRRICDNLALVGGPLQQGREGVYPLLNDKHRITVWFTERRITGVRSNVQRHGALPVPSVGKNRNCAVRW